MADLPEPRAALLLADAARRKEAFDTTLLEPHELVRLRREIVGHGVSRLVAALDPAPVRVTGVALSPAGGICGAARQGPIDAIRDWGVISFATRGEAEVPVAVRLMDAQQTRCWLLAADLHMAPGGEPRLLPGPDVIILPAVAAGDTARAVEYLHDAGLGEEWPGVLLLGDLLSGDDGLLSGDDGLRSGDDNFAGNIAHALCAFTEAPYLTARTDNRVNSRPIGVVP